MSTLFERLYRRVGAGYLRVMAAVTLVAVCLVVVPGYCALIVPVYELDAGAYVRLVAIWEAFLLPAGAIGMTLMTSRSLGPVNRWCAGERSPDLAQAVWDHVVAGLPRAVAGVLAWYLAGSIGAVAVVGLDLGFPAHAYLTYYLVIAALVGVAGVVAFLFFEQLLRPVLKEAVAELPEDAQLPPGMTLSRKAVLIVPVISFLTGVVVVANAVEDVAPEFYLAIGVASSLVVSSTIAALLARALRTSLVGRVHTLRDAMQAVDRGDLDVQVPPLAGDEIDEIGRSFNEMVAGLRERAALREDLQASRARIVAASDLARRRVERDLHDGAQQHLVLLRLRIAEARRQVEAGDGRAGETLDAAEDDVTEALRELRDLARGIFPTVLETDGLPAALALASQRMGLPTEVRCESGRLPSDVEAAVYFCCLEALQNAAKHAGAGARARVRVHATDRGVAFEVADDGAGFDPGVNGHGDGLLNMADRIGAVGGTLEVDATPGAGTCVRGRVPLRLAVPA